MVAVSFGAPGLQAANFLSLFGALDRLGGFFILASVREFAPFVCAIIVAGVAGTAITADLGARKIREELDALQVLGVDPIKNVVVPRFLALILITGLLDVYAILFGISGGIIAEVMYGQPLGGFMATLFNNASVTDLWASLVKCTMFGGIVAIVCCLQGDECVRRRRRRRPGRERGGRRLPARGLRLQLRLHADSARHPSRDLSDQVRVHRRNAPLRVSFPGSRWVLVCRGWMTVPRDWLASVGEIARFSGRVMGIVYSGRVFRFFGEALRQAGILILGSTIVIWGLVFILGLQCGIEGAYFNRSVGAPAYAGVFAAWCDLREVIPYAFGYMMAAKIGTGIVAELGAMRISDEIDALEVMGINPMIFLCGTRLLGAWLTLPFMYLAAIGVGYLASYLAVVQQIGEVSSGGYFLIFWMFQNPPDLIFSMIKAMFMATAIVLVGCYYGYTAGGGPVGVGTATAKSMVLNIVLVHVIGMMGTLVFWGANPRAPIGG